MTGIPRKSENGKKTRDLIFQTAVKILKEEGYDKVTVRRICKEMVNCLAACAKTCYNTSRTLSEK